MATFRAVNDFPAPLQIPIGDPMDAPPLRWESWPGRIRGHSSMPWPGAHGSGWSPSGHARSASAGIRRRSRPDKAYPSYEQLVSDPEVDIVYVASPHSEHAAQALLAITANPSWWRSRSPAMPRKPAG